MLDVRRATGENTIAVVEGVKARLDQVRRTLPKEATLTVTRDDSKFIYGAIASLEEHLVWGSFLAGLVVMFFIRNLRAVIIAWLAIPASIVATFTLMRAMDFTLNNMTLLALTLAVGIVIDDAIVVIENVERVIEEEPELSIPAATKKAMAEITGPIIAITLVLLSVFVPVAFIPGISGQLFRQFAVAVSTAKPTALVPGVPTIAASGIPGYEATQMTGVFTSAKAPAAMVARLNQEMVRALGRADVKEKFLSAGVEPVGSTPQEFAAFFRSEVSRYAEVIRTANIRLE